MSFGSAFKSKFSGMLDPDTGVGVTATVTPNSGEVFTINVNFRRSFDQGLDIQSDQPVAEALIDDANRVRPEDRISIDGEDFTVDCIEPVDSVQSNIVLKDA